jgi:DNA-binding IclR family transcriptional regulator
MLLLRELAARGHFGWGLGDLAARCALDKGTAHRLLAHLKRERMVQQRATDRRYILGPLVYELSLALPEYADFVQASRAPLERLAKRMRGVAFLFLRSGVDYVCALRVGSVPGKALSIDVGTRRPLISSSGGIAMLIAMPRDEVRAVVAQNLSVMSRMRSTSLATFEHMLKQSQARGLGINEQKLIPGWNAYALAVLDAHDAPFASVMVAAEASRMSLAANPDLVKVMSAVTERLKREAARLLPAPL